ncbi:hypothetical protein OIU84_022030 [Salix udensis]|uniref:Uncharacterized protein n=1 Tax=Salix udensis TaxID=889485 RepID=A0AAD6KMS2_9ROSI|nr:hypothetical protein OIU84_022030 [Salix udensis]
MISYPELVSFHFFIPGGNEDRVPFYKLKVLFPHSNLEIHREEVNEIARTAFSDEQYAKPSYKETVPFIIPTVHQFLSKSIYVSPNVIMKARVEEELIGVVLDNYAIATADVCSQRLKTHVNSDVLDALKALNLRERTDRKNPAIALALYSRYFKLSSSSMVKDITSSEVNSIMIIYYDGPKTSCMKSICGAALEYSHGNVLTQYLPSISDRILGT